ncbi:MAG: outer membrane beta-barrel protein [Chitinophagaceae bacterium]
MLQKIFATAVASMSFLPLLAQETETTTEASTEKKSTTTFSGMADVYYRWDFNKMAGNNKTSFTNSHNSFELGMISGKLEHKWDKVGLVADVGFGQRAEDFSYNDANTRFIIKQLNVSYSPKDWLKLTAGSWATHVGYELVDPNLNRNYSMSYLFSYGPFFHTGVKAEITTGKHGFMVGIANPTDLKSANDARKFFIGQYSFAASDAFKAYVNVLAGEDDPTMDSKTFQGDVVLTAGLSDKFSLGANASVNRNTYPVAGKKESFTWWGAAGYINFDPTESLGFTLRVENFDDKDQRNVFSSAAAGGSVLATTLSTNIKIKSLILIPEIRFESAGEEIYENKSGASKKTNGHFLVAAVYQF